MNESLTINAARANKLQFKSEKLTALTISLDSVYAEAAEMGRTANRRIACILSEIESSKCYTDDGYKSVADYAKDVFNIERSNAYQLATAGDVYNKYDEFISDPANVPSDAYRELASMTPSKLAEAVAPGYDKAIEAFESGAITPDSTQKEIRAWARNVKASTTQNGEVVKTYRINSLTSAPFGVTFEGGVISEVEEVVRTEANKAGYDSVEIVKITKGYSHKFAIGNRDGLKATMQRFLVILERQDGESIHTDSFIYELDEIVPEKIKAEKKPKKSAPTDAEIAKALGMSVEAVRKLRAGNAL